MIVEDERDEHLEVFITTPPRTSDFQEMEENEIELFRQFLSQHKKIKDKDAHFTLQNVLIEHLWERRGNEPM